MLQDTREQITIDERAEMQVVISELRPYILPLLMERQGNICNVCKQSADKYDIDHLVYHPKGTINELQALCIPCHKEKTDFRPFRYR